jgi:hypothetical protein
MNGFAAGSFHGEKLLRMLPSDFMRAPRLARPPAAFSRAAGRFFASVRAA